MRSARFAVTPSATAALHLDWCRGLLSAARAHLTKMQETREPGSVYIESHGGTGSDEKKWKEKEPCPKTGGSTHIPLASKN